MQTDPTPEHEWLKQLAGEWTFESECPAEPGKEPMKASGTESVRMLGELWAVCETTGDMPGAGPMTAYLTVGYDPARGAFVGNWYCSVMSSMFVYEGGLDGARKTLTLNTTGPDMTDPTKTATYRDIIELVSENERSFRSEMKTPGGWVEIMRCTHRRAK